MKRLPAPPIRIDPTEEYIAILDTAKGKASFKLFSPRIETLVNSFIFLATEEYYANTTFHRVVDGLLIQGGDPEGTGEGGPGYYLDDGFAGFRHGPGTLSMANCGPNTNGSQFFVTLVNAPWLDGKYSIIGELIDGMETLTEIRQGDALLSLTVRARRFGKRRALTWDEIVQHWKDVNQDQKKNDLRGRA
ncbi:MAG TPA: peptidylprolyl isomerase [Bryobacteraceae bacterium]